MKIIFSLIVAAIAGALFFMLGKGIGEWWADTLKNAGGLVTSSELIECQWVLPICIAGFAAYIVFKMANSND